MTTIISQAQADAIVALTISRNLQLRAHDGDPGAASDNEAPGLGYVEIADTEWSAMMPDPSTSARGGRRAQSTVELEFSDSAGDNGEIAYITYWIEDDPVGAPGVYDVRWKVVSIDPAVTYSSGNRVYIPAASLEDFAAGAE